MLMWSALKDGGPHGYHGRREVAKLVACPEHQREIDEYPNVFEGPPAFMSADYLAMYLNDLVRKAGGARVVLYVTQGPYDTLILLGEGGKTVDACREPLEHRP